MKIGDVVKAQIFGLEQLDDRTLRRLEPLLTKVQSNLYRQLNQSSQEDFDYIKKKQTLTVVNNAIARIDNILHEEMEAYAREYNQFGVWTAEQEMQSLAQVFPSLNRARLSTRRNTFLLNRMRASLDLYSAQTRSTIIRALQQAILQNVSGHKVTVSLQKYIDAKKWRLQRIVRTELHNVFNASKIISYAHIKEEYLPDLKKALYHPLDNRTAKDSLKLRSLHPIVDIDKPFRFKWKGEERVFMNPPDRPNDRSVLIPYRKKWSNKYKE